MSVIELKINKDLLNTKFEGYKLSLDPIPVLTQPIVDGINCVSLENEEYSYLQTRMALFLNHLHHDIWHQNSIFYVNEKRNIIWTSLGKDGRLTIPRCVWHIEEHASRQPANATVFFPASDWAVLCDGREGLEILSTPSRAVGEPWVSCHKYHLDITSPSYILHSVHRHIPGGQQIDCVVATVAPRSSFPSDVVSVPESCSFVSVLMWISLSCGHDIHKWIVKRTRKLASSSFPEYVALDSVGDSVCVVSQNSFVMYFDSDGPITPKVKIDKTVPTSPKYTYIQTPEEVTVYFKLPENVKRSGIQINLRCLHIEVLVLGQVVLSGALANCIDQDSSTWTLDGDRVEVTLVKTEAGLMWQELIKGDRDGEEIMDPALVDEVHSRLAHLTSENQVNPSNRVPFNLEQLEECDSSIEHVVFQRINGNEHCDTHWANMGGHQWLFSSQHSPESLPIICLRHDVDGIVWQPRNVCSEGDMEHFKIEHRKTFPALGYVSASKQDKKFTACSPDFSYCVISDCARHVYVYCQPESLQSAFQLRNRKTGESVAHIAKQYVISLENSDRILGLRVGSQCVFVLSKNVKSQFGMDDYTLYAVKIASVDEPLD